MFKKNFIGNVLFRVIPFLFFLCILPGMDKTYAGEPVNHYIPMLNAKVTGLRFYESGYYAQGPRKYIDRFPQSATRYVYWELNLEYPKPGNRIDFQILALYYQPDGSLLTRQVMKTYVESGWTSSQHSHGWGSNFPGTWNAGDYRVDLYIKEQKVASGLFTIYSSITEPTEPPIPPEKEKPSDDKKISDDEWKIF